MTVNGVVRRSVLAALVVGALGSSVVGAASTTSTTDSAYDLGNVVVTASRMAEQKVDVPADTTVITAGDIEKGNYTMVAQALQANNVQMVQNLEGMGFTVVPFGQGFKDMSPPTKELMKLTLEQRIAHGGQPVLRWMMDNIYIRTDPAGNIKPDKEKSTEKIDGAVATIMALDRALRNGGGASTSVYDGRGLLLI